MALPGADGRAYSGASANGKMSVTQQSTVMIAKAIVLLLGLHLSIAQPCSLGNSKLPTRSPCCHSPAQCCRAYGSLSPEEESCAPGPPVRIKKPIQTGQGLKLRWSEPKDNPEATLGYQVNLTCSWIDRSPHQGGARKTKTECFEIDGKDNKRVKISPTLCEYNPMKWHCIHSSIYSEFYQQAYQDDNATCSISIASVPSVKSSIIKSFTLKSCRQLGCPTDLFDYRHTCEGSSLKQTVRKRNLLCQCQIRQLKSLAAERYVSAPNTVYINWEDPVDEYFQANSYTVEVKEGKKLRRETLLACGKGPCNMTLTENYAGIVLVAVAAWPNSISSPRSLERGIFKQKKYDVKALCQLPNLLNGDVIGVREGTVTKLKDWFPAAHFECNKGYRLSNQTAEPFDCHIVNGIAKFKDQPTCDDINECHVRDPQHNCVAPAKCKNTNGSFECQCGFGYTGNGTHCSKCTFDRNGVISFTDGEFKCLHSGYMYVKGDSKPVCNEEGLWTNIGQCLALCDHPRVKNANFSDASPSPVRDKHRAVVVTCTPGFQFSSFKAPAVTVNCTVRERDGAVVAGFDNISLLQCTKKDPGARDEIKEILAVILCLIVVCIVGVGGYFLFTHAFHKSVSVQGQAGDSSSDLEKVDGDHPAAELDGKDGKQGTSISLPPALGRLSSLPKSPGTQNQLPAVYISFARSSELNKRRVQILASQLMHTHGFDVRLADKDFTQNDLQYSQCMPNWIEQNMTRCRYILVVVSEFYPHCYREYLQAILPPDSASTTTGETMISTPGSELPDSPQPGEDMTSFLERRLQELSTGQDVKRMMAQEALAACVAEARMSYDELCQMDRLAALECTMLDSIKMRNPTRMNDIIPVYLDMEAFDTILPLYLEGSKRFFINVSGKRGPFPPGMGDLTGLLPDLLTRLSTSK